jgi:16S rRNA (cytosine967-C5)-methyltransferase
MVAPARRCAFAVIRRVFEQGAYADRALHAEAEGLEPRDRRLATVLAYGTVQRRRTLDHLIAALSSRPPERLDPPVLAALRLGLFQLALLDGIAEHAAVNESVELVKRASGSGRGGSTLVNAVLRRGAREARGLVAALGDETPKAAAVLYSVPDWLAEMWWDELGPAQARELLARVNEPAESALRVNTLRATVEDVVARLPGETAPRPAPELPEGLVLGGPFDAFGSELWRAGAIMPQSRASMLVARTLRPRAGERALDLCAAPGSKTTHLAALMSGEGEVVAVEVHPGRARSLASTCERMGASSVTVRCADAREPLGLGSFDRVLVDPPCSGLGTLQSRPDLRWQARRAAIAELSAKQADLLAAGAAATAPGGRLVYSVCTISRVESDGVIDAFLAGAAGGAFACEERRWLLPHRDGTDGFFIARLRRA